MSNQISFSAQRKAFSNNLSAILNKLDYSVITFSLKLNSLLGERSSTLVSTSNVNEWINNEKLPNLYLLTKIGQLLNTSLDNLLSPNFSIDSFTGRSFSVTGSRAIAGSTTITNIDNSSSNKESSKMTSTSTTITVSAKRLSNLRKAAKERTDSNKTNYLLFDKVQSYGMLKDLATAVGCSTRTIRDTMYYNHSMNSETAKNLVVTLKSSYKGLGLILNRETLRYESAKIIAKK